MISICSRRAWIVLTVAIPALPPRFRRPPKMTDGVSGLNKVCCLSEIGVLPGTIDDGVSLALPDNQAGIDRVPGLALDRQGFTCADWSTSIGSPSYNRASAGMISPIRMRIKSPGTSPRAGIAIHAASRFVNANEKRSHSGRCWSEPVIHQSPLARMQYEL